MSYLPSSESTVTDEDSGTTNVWSTYDVSAGTIVTRDSSDNIIRTTITSQTANGKFVTVTTDVTGATTIVLTDSTGGVISTTTTENSDDSAFTIATVPSSNHYSLSSGAFIASGVEDSLGNISATALSSLDGTITSLYMDSLGGVLTSERVDGSSKSKAFSNNVQSRVSKDRTNGKINSISALMRPLAGNRALTDTKSLSESLIGEDGSIASVSTTAVSTTTGAGVVIGSVSDASGNSSFSSTSSSNLGTAGDELALAVSTALSSVVGLAPPPVLQLNSFTFSSITVQITTEYSDSFNITKYNVYWLPYFAGSSVSCVDAVNRVYRISGLTHNTTYSIRAAAVSGSSSTAGDGGMWMSSKSVDALEVTTVSLLPVDSKLRTATISGNRVNRNVPKDHFNTSEDGSVIISSADLSNTMISRDYGLTWEQSPYTPTNWVWLANYGISPNGQFMVVINSARASATVNNLFVAVSTDSGYTWKDVTANVPYLGYARSVGNVYLLHADIVCSDAGAFLFGTRGVTNVATDPNYKNYIWATKDAGATFSPVVSTNLGSDAGVNLIWYTADSTLSRIAYVLEPVLANRAYGAVYVTEDLGVTTTKASLPAARRIFLSGDGKTLVLLTQSGGSLLVYTAGANGAWTTMSSLNGSLTFCSMNYDGTKMAMIVSGVVKYSVDRGFTFSSLATGETYTYLHFQKSSATDVVPLAVRRSTGAIVRCEDFFSKTSITAAVFNVPAQPVTRYPAIMSSGNNIIKLATSSDVSVVYAAGIGSAAAFSFNIRSLDSGKSFTEMYSGPNSDGAVMFYLYACDSTGRIAYALDDINNTLYKSTDYGASWAAISGVTFGGTTLTCSSNGVFVICSDKWSRDSGGTWGTLASSLINLYDIQMLTDGTFWAPNSSSAATSLYKGDFITATNSYALTVVTLPSVPLALQSMVCSSDGKYIYLMSMSSGSTNNSSVDGAFVRSVNGGATFEVFLAVKFKAYPKTMSCSNNGSVIMYSDYYQSVYRSVDYGSTWSYNDAGTTTTPTLFGSPNTVHRTLVAPDSSSKYILKDIYSYKVYS